ncbi:MAG: glycosyltransferase family 39 protein [Candidatus Omnitrophica bacterium]|nr:glycosyltransferase family 39 protein [Candidatus Omnitrophota bacterium]
MSVVYSSLTVLIFYFFIAKLFDNLTAFCAGILLSLNPIFLTLSVYGNSHTVSIFYLLLSLTFLVSQFKRRLLFFALTLGLFGAARLQDMILMLPAVFILFLNQTQERIKTKVYIFIKLIFISLFVALIFHLPYFFGPSSKNYLSQLQHFYNLGVTSNFDGVLSRYLFSNIKFFCVVNPAIIFTFIGFIYLLRNKRIAYIIFLLCWIFIPFSFYGNILTSAPRFYLISIIPTIILESYAVSSFLQIKNNFFRICLVSLVFTLAFLPLPKNTFPILKFRHTTTLLPDWAKFIKDRTEPTALIISGDDNFVINHYAQRGIFSRPIDLNANSQNELKEFKRNLDAALSTKTPIYITTTGLISYDPNGILQKFLIDNYRFRFLGKSVSEDWHNGELKLDIIDEELWQILPKNDIPQPPH